MAPPEIDRVHERFDDVMKELGDIKAVVAQCNPCREQVKRHEEAIYGNGRDGLLTRVTTMERHPKASGDVVSVRSMTKILASVGTLIGAIAAAIGAAVAAAMR